MQTALASYTLTDNVEDLLFTSIIEHTGTGNALDNAITGNVEQDTLDGKDGNDTLAGSAGDSDGLVDTLKGGKGNDTYLVYGETEEHRRACRRRDRHDQRPNCRRWTSQLLRW